MGTQPRTLVHHPLIEFNREQIEEALRTPGAHVQLTVPLLPEDEPMTIPAPSDGVTLEIGWASNQLRDACVRLEGCKAATAGYGQGPPRITVFGWETSEVEIIGELHAEAIHAEDVSLIGSLTATRLTAVTAFVRRVALGPVMVGLRSGQFDGELLNDGGLLVESARKASLRGSAPADPLVTVRGRVTGSELTSVRLQLEPNAMLQECSGSVQLVGAANATLIGSRGRTLAIASAFPAFVPNATRPLDGAVLMDVAIEPASLATIVHESEVARIFDPAPETIARSLRPPRGDPQISLAELLHDRLGEKALRQPTVDAAALAVLDARRRSSARRSSERLLLTAYGLLGYGRMIARPLAVWTAVVLVVLGIRAAQALRDPGGVLNDRGGVHVVAAAPEIQDAVSDVLAVVLLPITWAQGTNHEVERRVGLHGGYLPAVRLMMIVPLLAAAGGVRRRVRVRPHRDGR